MSFSDETLSTYLDGETDAETTAAIERALEADPELAERLAAFTSTDEALRQAFGRAVAGPLPEGIAQALKTRPEAQVLPFRRRLLPTGDRGMWSGAIAAGVAGLIIGAGLTGAGRGGGDPLVVREGGTLVARSSLGSALSEARSGQEVETAAGVLSVALSFQADDGRLCRQFAVSGEEVGSAGVACRSGDDWRLEAWLATGAVPGGGYQTAAGPGDPLLEGVIDRLGVAEALDRAGEAAAIDGEWKPRPATGGGR